MASSPTEGKDTKPRNNVACDFCRNHKYRCVSSEQPGVCQRCSRVGNTCTFLQPRGRGAISNSSTIPRKEKRKRSPDNSETGSNLLTPAASVQSSDTPKNAASNPQIDADAMLQLHQESFQHMMDITPDGTNDTDKLDSSTEGKDDDISSRLLNLPQANALLISFRASNSYFPFVIIPDDATVPSMSKRNPFLLLACMTVASTKDFDLHPKMVNEFCQVLGTKIIMKGEASLDILQGLLVYIAWYPFHIKLRSKQIFTYLQMAFSMVVQLKLDHKRPHAGSKIDRQNASKRAYLGCYYLSSSVAAAFEKPNAVEYTAYTKSCGEFVAQNSEVLTDQAIPWLIEQQRIADDISRALRSQKLDIDEQLSLPLLRLKLEAARNDLNLCQAMTPAVLKDLTIIQTSSNYVSMIVDSYAILTIILPTFSTMNSFQINPVLQEIMEDPRGPSSTKQYLDHFVTIPPTEYTQFSAVEWCQMVRAITVALKLSTCQFVTHPLASTLKAETRKTIQLNTFLESLCWRMQRMAAQTKGTSKSKTLSPFALFGSALDNLYNLYQKRLNQEKEEAINSEDPWKNYGYATSVSQGDRCPMKYGYLSPTSSTPGSITMDLGGDPWDGLLGDESGLSVTGVPLYFDLWATMTQNWAS